MQETTIKINHRDGYSFSSNTFFSFSDLVYVKEGLVNEGSEHATETYRSANIDSKISHLIVKMCQKPPLIHGHFSGDINYFLLFFYYYYKQD